MDFFESSLGSSITAKAAVVALAVLAVTLFFTASRQKATISLPVWVPLEMALVQHLFGAGGAGRRLYSMVRRYGGPLFGLSSSHQVIPDMPEIERFFNQPGHVLDAYPVGWTMVTRVFGTDNDEELFQKAGASMRPLWSCVEKVFVNDAASTRILQNGDIPGKAHSLVSFKTSPEEQKRWERSANLKVVSPETNGFDGVVEANLQSLIRDFGFCVAVPPLFGHDFLEREKTLIEDFWKFDNDLFPLLLIGLPKWLPLKVMREGLAARDRVNAALIGFHQRLDQYCKGNPVDFGADLSDVSEAILNREPVFDKAGISIRHRGQIAFSFFWAQNGNSQPMLFWMLTFIFSTSGLVDELRRELAPFVEISTATYPPQITAMDIGALHRDCPLLKSSMYEAFRLADESVALRLVRKPVTVANGSQKYELKAGTWISSPSAILQQDPAVFPEPKKFIPDRFIKIDPETGRKIVNYGKMRPWGMGPSICKGRTFAEKEIVSIVAAVLLLWDVEPANGVWKVPGMRPGTGVNVPTEDIRVAIRRRKF